MNLAKLTLLYDLLKDFDEASTEGLRDEIGEVMERLMSEIGDHPDGVAMGIIKKRINTAFRKLDEAISAVEDGSNSILRDAYFRRVIAPEFFKLCTPEVQKVLIQSATHSGSYPDGVNKAITILLERELLTMYPELINQTELNFDDYDRYSC